MDEFIKKTRKAMLEDNSLYEDYAYKYIVEDIMFKSGKIYNGLNVNGADSHQTKSPIVPGNIYTFKYVSSTDLSKPMDQGPSNYDTIPVVMCVSATPTAVKGVNLNLCSRAVKTGIINELQNIDPEYYLEKAPRTGVLKGSPNVAKLFTSDVMTSKFLEIVCGKCKVDASDLIVRSYLIEGIKYIKVIDLNLWKYIPFLRYKSALREDTLRSIMNKVSKR